MAAPISAAVLHPLPPPTECHKVQVLFTTTKKKLPKTPLQKRTLYLRFKTPIQRLKHYTQLKDRVQLENKDISVAESTLLEHVRSPADLQLSNVDLSGGEERVGSIYPRKSMFEASLYQNLPDDLKQRL